MSKVLSTLIAATFAAASWSAFAAEPAAPPTPPAATDEMIPAPAKPETNKPAVKRAKKHTRAKKRVHRPKRAAPAAPAR